MTSVEVEQLGVVRGHLDGRAADVVVDERLFPKARAGAELGELPV